MAGSKVVIFCADGDTGHRLAQLLRKAGRDVIAVVRRRADPTLLERMGCEIAVADPTDRAEVEAVFHDRNPDGMVVVCMLGGTPQLNSQGNINVIDATVAAGAQRLILLTSIGCGDSAGAVDPFVKAFIGKALKAKNWAEAHLQSTDLAWTIIRPGGMLRRPGKGGPILVENPNVTGYINSWDLGDVVLQVLESPRTAHRILTAVDRGKAFDVKGEPLVPAEL